MNSSSSSGTLRGTGRPVRSQDLGYFSGRDALDWGFAALILPAGARGPAFLITDNFAAIEAYNRADSYVIAVGHLSDRIKGAPPIQAAWPREFRALTLEERIQLQEGLTRAGFSTQGADGKIGPRTQAAIRAFQKAKGLTPDGYASPELLPLLP